MDTFYCCYIENDRLCEDMVNEHMLVYLCSGEMTLISKEKKYHLKKGDSFLLKRNHMLRKIKQPCKSGEPFKGLFLQLRMPFLKKMISENNITVSLAANSSVTKANHVMLPKHPFLKGLFSSLEQYFDAQQYPSKELMNIKLKEAVYTLLQINPELGSVLFDFAEPWKIDLNDFMNQNYKNDLSIEEFAHYTGRSLSTFKRDFYNLYHITPSRWLIKKRLEEAKILIDKAGKSLRMFILRSVLKTFPIFPLRLRKSLDVLLRRW